MMDSPDKGGDYRVSLGRRSGEQQSSGALHHKKLLAWLSERIEGWQSAKTIGDIVLEHTQFFLLYSAVCRRYPRILVTMRRLACSNASFASRVQAFVKALPQKLDVDTLDDALRVIFGRLGAYVTMLQAVRASTPRAHADWDLLERSLAWVTGVRDAIMAGVDFAEIQSIEALLATVDGIEGKPGQELVVHGRKLLREGPASVGVLFASDSKTISVPKAQLFLMSDVLVCCEIRQSGKSKAPFVLVAQINRREMQCPSPGLWNGTLAVALTAPAQRWLIIAPNDQMTKAWTKELASWFCSAQPASASQRNASHMSM
eukprot:m51a1_g370 hypothetical protein (316) ;mRNA; r:629439-630638